MEHLKKLTPDNIKIINNLNFEDILLINHLNFGDITAIRDLGEEGVLRLKSYKALISTLLIVTCFLLITALVLSGMYIFKISKHLNHIRLLEEILVIAL